LISAPWIQPFSSPGLLTRRLCLNFLRITAAFHDEPLPTYMQWTAGGLAPGLPKICWTLFWKFTLRLTRQPSGHLTLPAPPTHSPLLSLSFSRRVPQLNYGFLGVAVYKRGRSSPASAEFQSHRERPGGPPMPCKPCRAGRVKPSLPNRTLPRTRRIVKPLAGRRRLYLIAENSDRRRSLFQFSI
jgi:hypothetical protein